MKYRLRIGVAAMAAMLLPGSALATSTLICDALDNADLHLEVHLGHTVVEAAVGVRIEVGGALWSTLESDAGAEPIAIAQFFADADRLHLDVADPSLEELGASLRLLRVADGADFVQAGYLSFPGEAAFAVTCVQ